MYFLIVKQPLSAEKPRGAHDDERQSDKDESEPLVRAKRPG